MHHTLCSEFLKTDTFSKKLVELLFVNYCSLEKKIIDSLKICFPGLTSDQPAVIVLIFIFSLLITMINNNPVAISTCSRVFFFLKYHFYTGFLGILAACLHCVDVSMTSTLPSG